MSILELAYAQGQLDGLMLEKRAWPAPTSPTVANSGLLTGKKTQLPESVPQAPATPQTVSQTWNLQEQAKTRLAPQRKLSELDSLRALTESMYATHGPQGVVNTIGANPGLRGQMLGHVKTLAGAAAPRPQHGMFSGVMQTQSTPLRAAVSGKIGTELCTTCRKAKHYGTCSAPRPIPEKNADFNPGLSAASSEAGIDGPATSPNYHSATSADTSLARARDTQPADVQAGTAFADLYRHLGITSQTDEPGRQYGGLHKVSRFFLKSGGWQLWGTGGHSMWEDRGPGQTPNPYEERLTIKSPPVGWGDEAGQRIKRTFDQNDIGANLDTANIENTVPDSGPAVGL